MRRNRQGGFSLVELIVVLAVIAVLAALVIPRYASTRGQAADARVIALLGSIRSALLAYEAKYGNFDGLPCGNLNSSNWNLLRDRLREFAELPDWPTLSRVVEAASLCHAHGTFAGRGYYVGMIPKGGTGYGYVATPDALWRCTPGNESTCTVM